MNKIELPALSRRRFIHGAGATLSGATFAMLAGVRIAGAAEAPAEDAKILNIALGLEHEAINAYQLGAESKLLEKPVLDVAVLFQSHHKAHRDALVSAIQKLGGTPVAEKSKDEYARALKAETLKSQTDVLNLAAKLELGAANAYLGVIPSFKDANLAKVAGRLAADETSHWSTLNAALGGSPPKNALYFGA
jgi:rubrerythrin